MVFIKETLSSKSSSLASEVEKKERTGPGLGWGAGHCSLGEELGLGIKGRC